MNLPPPGADGASSEDTAERQPENSFTDLQMVRGAASSVGAVVNEFLHDQDLGRPVDVGDASGHVTAALRDGAIVGAAYAAQASGVAEHLLLSGEDPSAADEIYSLEAIAVHPSLRRSGLGTQLLASVAEHSRRDYAAKILLARIEKGDADLIEWYRARGFVICEPDQVLRIGPVRITPSEGHRDSWMDLGHLRA